MKDNIINSKYSKFSVGLISPYKGLAELFAAIAEKNNIKTFVRIGSLSEATDIANELRNKVDVFLSRWGTAEYIKKSVDVPVVSIPVTAFDILRTVHSSNKLANEAAVFTYENTVPGIKDIEKILQIRIHEYTFIFESDIEEKMKDVKRKGINLVIGGMTTVGIAEKYGMQGMLVECGEEAIQQSLGEALRIAEVRNTELERSARYKVILDSITEGIIVTDDSNKVILFNPSAEKIFRIPSQEVLDKVALDVIPNSGMHNVLKTGEQEIGVLQDINGGTIATNRVPIEVEGKRIGVVSTFEDITKIQQLEQKIREKMHKKGFEARHSFASILTNNYHMLELKRIATLYAKTDSSILIQGESGTGKELFAQSIHNASKRCNGPFVAVNCAAIPENLLESELFGYEGGAFSGARKEGKQGLFELAHNGTIFLDEIGEISKTLQARLLRVIQEKEIMRVGGDKIIPVDIRIVSATNQDLQKLIERGEFRQDLYYRLNVFNIRLLPLRERKDDIPLIISQLIRKYCTDNSKIDRIISEINPILTSYDWPGNVRELSNIVERLSLVLLEEGSENWRERLKKIVNISDEDAEDGYIDLKVNINKGLKEATKDVEKDIINSLLIKYNQDKEKVIEALKIGRATFWRKM